MVWLLVNDGDVLVSLLGQVNRTAESEDAGSDDDNRRFFLRQRHINTLISTLYFCLFELDLIQRDIRNMAYPCRNRWVKYRTASRTSRHFPVADDDHEWDDGSRHFVMPCTIGVFDAVLRA